MSFLNKTKKRFVFSDAFIEFSHNVLPIVMGASEEEYRRAAPQHSFIHVNQFKGPKELAEYLHQLDQNDEKYNEYFQVSLLNSFRIQTTDHFSPFQWKGTGEFINTRFFCRVCALLHDTTTRPKEHSHYPNINSWWRGTGTCDSVPWRDSQNN